MATYQDIEKKMREDDFKAYLIGLVSSSLPDPFSEGHS
jgi:hypothetical protein